MDTPLSLPTFPLPTARWLVAVSGGGDSMALLHLLVQNGWGPAHCTVAHFNHKWSPWGDEAEAFVRATCTQLGLPLVVGQGAGKAASNAESKARTERHTFFKEAATSATCAGVLLAHTQTDVLETTLLRIGKGSGLTGLTSPLKAHATVNGLALWRPLLGVQREVLRTYLTTHGHAWLNDPADAARANQRARLRAAMPQLAALGLTAEGLLGSLSNLARAEAALQAQTATAFQSVCQGESPTHIAFSRPQVLAQPDEIAQRLLGMALARAGGQTPRTSKRLALLARLREEPSGKATLGTCRFQWSHNTLDISF